MKAKLIIFSGVFLAVACLTGWLLAKPFLTIRQLEARYQTVQPGMGTNEVQAIMNFQGRWHTNGTYRGWGDVHDTTTDTPHIGYAAAYTVPTFFLPVTFEFVFDENGKAEGKHRYD